MWLVAGMCEKNNIAIIDRNLRQTKKKEKKTIEFLLNFDFLMIL